MTDFNAPRWADTTLEELGASAWELFAATPSRTTCIGMFADRRRPKHRVDGMTPTALTEDLTPGTGRRAKLVE